MLNTIIIKVEKCDYIISKEKRNKNRAEGREEGRRKKKQGK